MKQGPDMQWCWQHTVNGVGNKQFASGQRIRAEQDYSPSPHIGSI